MAGALARHDAIVREAVGAHGGTVFSTMGDGMAAVFASAKEAVRAVLAAPQELAAEDWGESIGPLAARMGLWTDEAADPDVHLQASMRKIGSPARVGPSAGAANYANV
jgi:class 3 adenylate cyclase